MFQFGDHYDTLENAIPISTGSMVIDMTESQETILHEESQDISTDKRARCWVFTLNGLDVAWADWSILTVNDFIESLSNRAEVRFISGGVEHAPSSDRTHFQGYIEFTKAMRYTAVGTLLDSRFKTLKYRPPSKQRDLPRGYTYAPQKKPHNLTYISTKKGTREQARDYSMKQGKYEEESSCQVLQPIAFGKWVDNGQRLDLEDLAVDIENGKSDIQIFNRDPVVFMRHQRMIRETRSMLTNNKWSNIYRDIQVCYISGATRTGKTSLITRHFGYENVHRITDLDNPWDSYTSQPVVIFEEFRESFPLHSMLAWLEGHPVELPARYFNRQAAFTKVFIISNWPWSSQYESIREHTPEDYAALMARIQHNIKFVQIDGKPVVQCDSPNHLGEIFTNHLGQTPSQIQHLL